MASLDAVISNISRLDDAVEDALNNEVAEAVKDAIVIVAREKVYDSYTPEFLSIRNGSGGIFRCQ